jgi:hypothetical protein
LATAGVLHVDFRCVNEVGALLDLSHHLQICSAKRLSGWVCVSKCAILCTREQFFSHPSSHTRDETDTPGTVVCVSGAAGALLRRHTKHSMSCHTPSKTISESNNSTIKCPERLARRGAGGFCCPDGTGRATRLQGCHCCPSKRGLALENKTCTLRQFKCTVQMTCGAANKVYLSRAFTD